MPLKKATEATPDYEAMVAARKLTAEDNKWLREIAAAFKSQGDEQRKCEDPAERTFQRDSEKP